MINPNMLFLGRRKFLRFDKIFTTALLLAVGASGQAHAAFTQVPIGAFVNGNLRTYTLGALYPVAPTALSVGSVPFDLVPLGGVADSLGVIQTPPGESQFTIPTNVPGATTVYTLINSAFGAFGAINGSVEFEGAGGAFASFDLVQGTNIRDHFFGDFNNVIAPGLCRSAELTHSC